MISALLFDPKTSRHFSAPSPKNTILLVCNSSPKLFSSIISAEVGFTLCEALIARNGSILLSNAGMAGRRLSIYPPIHIVLAYTSQLVPDLKDGFKLIKSRYGNQLPSMISNVTGPSRTADIEKTLVLGAHGPKELFVFLLDG